MEPKLQEVKQDGGVIWLYSTEPFPDRCKGGVQELDGGDQGVTQNALSGLIPSHLKSLPGGTELGKAFPDRATQ